MGRKVWNINTYDKNAASVLARKCGADDFAVLLLQSRGITKAEDVMEFISSEEKDLSSPYLLQDMEKAVLRIREAIEAGEKIHVFGDYDADGVTGTALLTSYLDAVGADVTCSIPSRLHDGYGLSPEAAHRIARTGVNLVITVDNGIASFEEAEIFKSYGIDFIVTDHHKVGNVLPAAFAVINPHREDDNSPEENLAGVGVALKLAAALEDGDYTAIFEDFGDLAAIGTVADIVPLTGENRVIVSRGLKCIENSFRPGILALLESAGLNGEINASAVAFGIAPRINAAGRMDNAETALRLLLTDDEEDANILIKEIASANTQRQNVEVAISEEIENYFNINPNLRNDAVIVAYGENWHPGVIGIAASRLVEKYGRPALVISVGEDGISRGSGRSIDGFSLYDALSFCSEHLLQFGGHTLAAGFSIEKDKIELFRNKINEYASGLPEFYPTLDIDIRLNPRAVSTDILDSLAVLEPYGAGNPTPHFGIFGMKIGAVKSIGGDRHIRLTLTKDSDSITAVYFGQTLASFPYKTGDTVDVAVKIEKNEFRGETRVSIQVKDIRPAGEDDKGMFNSIYLYRRFLRGEVLSEKERLLLCPDRTLLGEVYRFIKEHKIWNYSEEILCMRLGIPFNKAGAVRVCLDALKNVGILKENGGEYSLTDFTGKADLRNCEILQKLSYIY
ncbi:MAG: single-stranded-DNA-specific exonuclease RecJ [Clostridia bacterium]|nr:single-stranded-DNA-specific exonuclease RecJ [Clostridia bacterium]